MDRAHHGDPDVIFAMAAAGEEVNRRVEMVEQLMELHADGYEAVCETIADAMSA